MNILKVWNVGSYNIIELTLRVVKHKTISITVLHVNFHVGNFPLEFLCVARSNIILHRLVFWLLNYSCHYRLVIIFRSYFQLCADPILIGLLSIKPHITILFHSNSSNLLNHYLRSRTLDTWLGLHGDYRSYFLQRLQARNWISKIGLGYMDEVPNTWN